MLSEMGDYGENRIDLEKLLAEGQTIQIKPEGYSMYLVLVPGRDGAVIEPVKPGAWKRGDVVLYRREGSVLVLHRICKCTAEGVWLVGDNQVAVEGPLKPEQVKGKMVALVRRGKCISVQNIWYRMATGIWLWLRPVRPMFKKPAAWVKRRLKRK